MSASQRSRVGSRARRNADGIPRRSATSQASQGCRLFWARGRFCVLGTPPSKWRSAKSLMAHPALRVSQTPATKMKNRRAGGCPRPASQSDQSVGQSRSRAPIGRFRRVSRAYSPSRRPVATRVGWVRMAFPARRRRRESLIACLRSGCPRTDGIHPGAEVRPSVFADCELWRIQDSRDLSLRPVRIIRERVTGSRLCPGFSGSILDDVFRAQPVMAFG